MNKKILLSACHHMLYKELWEDSDAYVKSMSPYLEHPFVSYYEGWLPREKRFRDEAVKRIKDSGKPTVYDIGPRPGIPDPDPSASDPGMIAYTLDFYRAELDLAFAIGAKKIVLDAGNDVPDNRKDAKRIAGEFLYNLGQSIPKDVIVVMENTDRDLQRRKLFGPTVEMMDFIKDLRDKGLAFLHPMVDMGHIPLYEETIDHSLDTIAPLIAHVHLANCIVDNPDNPLFGDRHVPFGWPESVYGNADLITFMKKLDSIGYLKDNNTISFEIINLDKQDPIEYLDEWSKLMNEVMDLI